MGVMSDMHIEQMMEAAGNNAAAIQQSPAIGQQQSAAQYAPVPMAANPAPAAAAPSVLVMEQQVEADEQPAPDATAQIVPGEAEAEETGPDETPSPETEDAGDEENEGESDEEDAGEENAAAPSVPAKKDDDPLEKLRKHEASEAKRKAAWEAEQAKKKAEHDAQMAEVSAMSAEDLEKASLARVDKDVEKLTRRNMKLCVAEHVQTKCLEDPAFARLTMHPQKSMLNCFHYINRKAREFIEKELKDNDEEFSRGGYGGDVPDDIVYQWAEAYFRDMKAKEDEDKDAAFVPKSPPYVPAADKKKHAAEKKKAAADAKAAATAEKAAAKKAAAEQAAAEKEAAAQVAGQLSIGEVA